MSTNIRPLCPELAEKAASELGENPERVAEDLQSLKQWLVKQPHLISKSDDQFLISFLRGCKFSVQRAKEKIDSFYTVRTAIPEFYSHRDPMSSKLQLVLKTGVTFPLPQTQSPADARIFVIRQGMYDVSKLHVTDVMKVSYMITDLLMLEDDNSVIGGQIIVVDLKGLSFAHMAQATPTLLKKMATCIQDSYPIRTKGFHFLHPLPGFDALFTIFKSFMSEKAKNRIHVHDNVASLHIHIDKKVLPSEYGGDAGPLKVITENWKKRLENNRQFFLDDEKFHSDESKRQGKPKNAQTLFGVEGSFRQLNVD